MNKAAILALLALLASLARGAGIYTEEFTADMAGWQNDHAATSYRWKQTNGELRITFPPTGSSDLRTAELLATNTSSGGAFVGNYPAAGIQCLGFRFRADNELPSALAFYLRSETNSISRPDLAQYVTETGRWYQFYLPVISRASGSWIGNWAAGDEGTFLLAVTNIVWIRVDVRPASRFTNETYRLDSFFSDGLPYLQNLAGVTGGPAAATFDRLRTGTVYAVESGPSVWGPWTAAAQLHPTGRTHTIIVPLTNAPVGMLRLLSL